MKKTFFIVLMHYVFAGTICAGDSQTEITKVNDRLLSIKLRLENETFKLLCEKEKHDDIHTQVEKVRDRLKLRLSPEQWVASLEYELKLEQDMLVITQSEHAAARTKLAELEAKLPQHPSEQSASKEEIPVTPCLNFEVTEHPSRTYASVCSQRLLTLPDSKKETVRFSEDPQEEDYYASDNENDDYEETDCSTLAPFSDSILDSLARVTKQMKPVKALMKPFKHSNLSNRKIALLVAAQKAQSPKEKSSHSSTPSNPFNNTSTNSPDAYALGTLLNVKTKIAPLRKKAPSVNPLHLSLRKSPAKPYLYDAQSNRYQNKVDVSHKTMNRMEKTNADYPTRKLHHTPQRPAFRLTYTPMQ